MRMQHFVRLLLFLCLMGSLSGCASFGQKLKAFLNGQDAPEDAAPKEELVTFSERNQMPPGPRRKYKRMTKQKLEEEALLESQSGSLWVMEGQGAYLFSQNIVRMIGDPITVQIDGDPRAQLESKVGVIQKLLSRLEERLQLQQQRELQQRNPAAEGAAPANPEAPANPQQQAANAPATPAAASGNSPLSVKNVPTRIIERLIDGNYRVKGSQPFMIGTREYKVIVTGIIRAEDFSEEGISATKLLDPKFDIVSVRRKDAEI